MNISAANKRIWKWNKKKVYKNNALMFFLLFFLCVWFHQKICFWKIVCCFARKQFPFNLHTEKESSCFSGFYGVQPKHCMPPISKKPAKGLLKTSTKDQGWIQYWVSFLFSVCLFGEAVFYSVSRCYLWYKFKSST